MGHCDVSTTRPIHTFPGGSRTSQGPLLYNGVVSKASRIHWNLLFSHSKPEDLDRCLVLSLGQTRIHLCTRCVGLYPTMLLALCLFLWGFPTPQWLDIALCLVLPIVGASAWGLEQAGVTLPKSLRLLSGAFLGLGLARVLTIHFVTPWPRELLELGAALAVILLLGWIARTLRKDRDQIPLITPIDPTMIGDDKKTDPCPENEVDPKSS